MAEYIKKEAVIKFIENGLNNPDKTKSFGHDAIEIMAEVQYIPAADIVEIRHGKWLTADIVEIRHGKWFEDEYDETTYCSECKEEALYESTFELQFDYDWEENLVPYGYEEHRTYIRTKYCPHCGAKMDGDTE